MDVLTFQLVREMELIDVRKNKELEQLLKNAKAKNG